MEEKELEFLFTKKNINGESILQLKDGKLLFYNPIGGARIILYSQKTFQKIYELNFDKLIKKLEEENAEFDEEDDDEKPWLKSRWSRRYSRDYNDKISIKELDNGLLLIGYNKYLIEFYPYENIYSSKVVKKFKATIMDIIVLSEKRFIIIANDNIKEVIKEKEKYVIKKKYPFKENWKDKPSRSTIDIEYSDFHQYYCSYLLSNDKLLLNNFSIESFDYTGCCSHPTEHLTYSKIILIDLKNFEEIASTKAFNKYLRVIILKNIIVVQVCKNLTLYDINSLQPIKDIKLERYYNFLYKYNNKYLIAISVEENNDNINIFKIENNDLIKSYSISKYLSFMKKYRSNDYFIEEYINNPLLILKDKRIIIIYENKLYILKINFD